MTNVFVEETVDTKNSDNLKASEFLEEVFVTNVAKTSKLHNVWKTIVIKHTRIYQKIINTSVTNAITKTTMKRS